MASKVNVDKEEFEKRRVFTERLEKAMKYGWTVSKIADGYDYELWSPFSQTSGLGARRVVYTTLDGKDIIVPSYFWLDNVLETGG